MENLKFHKQKLYALIIAAVGFISVFLPWWKVSFGFGGFGSYSQNGFRDLGIITFLGFVGAGVVIFAMGDKTKPFEGQVKMIAAACFAGAGLFALIQLLRQSHFTSYGLYLSILAGIAGAVLVYVIKPEQLDGKKPSSS